MIFDWGAPADGNGTSRGGWSFGELNQGSLEPLSDSMAHRSYGICNVHTSVYFLREAAGKVGSARLLLFRVVVYAFKLLHYELIAAGCI